VIQDRFTKRADGRHLRVFTHIVLFDLDSISHVA
jgi:hypothetical protein